MTMCEFSETGSPVHRCAGERAKFNRNRKIAFGPDAVQTDGRGNIVSRPLTKRLPCFGDPVEHLRGMYDRPFALHRADGTTDYIASGCFKCGVRDACHRVVAERLTSVQGLQSLNDAWQRQTKTLAGDATYTHPSYRDLVQAIEQESWCDSNDEALEAEADLKREKRARDARKGRRDIKPKAKVVAHATIRRINAHCDQHKAELRELAASPSAPLWLRNRSTERIDLIADAWRVQRLILEANGKGSGREVANRLLKEGAVAGPIPVRFVKLVEEALRRAASLWEHFADEPVRLRQYGNGMHPLAVHELLEDENMDGGEAE